MKKNLLFGFLVVGTCFAFSCKKGGGETNNISTPPLQIGASISTNTHGGAVKGTMLTGNTYTITSNLIIPQGDTLLLQPGVTLDMGPNTWIIVHGMLLSLGTASNPNYIGAAGQTHVCTINQNPASDPAYAGLWGGVMCDSLCPALELKWTHLEYGGAAVVTPQVKGSKAGDAYSIYFINPNGYVVLEDDWFYGGVDDFFRFQGGKIACLRNTWQKNSLVSGDNLNAKNGTQGDMAYNMFIGTCTNGTKAADKGSGGPQCWINMYNNTYVNGGYRQTSAGRAGAIDYEQGARGFYCNNLVVDCKFGPRIVNNPVADTAHMYYGWSFQYGDSLSVVNQFYPTTYITKPQPSDIPAYTSYLPSNYTLGATYNASTLLGLMTASSSEYDPQFVNYPLPNYQHIITTAGCNGSTIYDFHLKSTSPCIGKGTTSKYTPLMLVPLATSSNPVGVTTYNMPGADIGCYQSNGSGNQHTTW